MEKFRIGMTALLCIDATENTVLSAIPIVLVRMSNFYTVCFFWGVQSRVLVIRVYEFHGSLLSGSITSYNNLQ